MVFKLHLLFQEGVVGVSNFNKLHIFYTNGVWVWLILNNILVNGLILVSLLLAMWQQLDIVRK